MYKVEYYDGDATVRKNANWLEVERFSTYAEAREMVTHEIKYDAYLTKVTGLDHYTEYRIVEV